MKKQILCLLAIVLGIQYSVNAQVDYESDIQPIFNASCTSCHGSNGGVNLTSYEQLMSSTGTNYGNDLVVAGDPDASGLVDKIEPNPQFGSRMPQGGSLTDEQITLIRTWISEGANEVATAAEPVVEIPSAFRLMGNYPNPFNPTTNIEFVTPEAVQYTISIYTVHGMLVGEQVGNVATGKHSVPVNLTNSPTGMYIYRLSVLRNGVNELLGTGRMTLIK